MRFEKHKKAAEGEFTQRSASRKDIFGGKPHLTRSRFRRALADVPRHIPGTEKFSREERVAMEKELFPEREYGAYISPYEINKRIKQSKRQLFASQDQQEKIDLRKQVDFLKKLRGPENKI